MTRVAVTVRPGRTYNRKERGTNRAYKEGEKLTVSEHVANTFADAFDRDSGPVGVIPPRELPSVPGTDDDRTDPATDAAALTEQQGKHDADHLPPAPADSLDATNADPVSHQAKLASLAANGTPDPRNPDAKVAQPQNTDPPAGSAEGEQKPAESAGPADPVPDALVTGLAGVGIKVNPEAVASWSDAERDRAQGVIDRGGKGNLPQFVLAAKVE